MTIPWSKSLYRVTIGGTNVSDRIAPYLSSITVTDNDKAESDSASITLDDQGARFAIPEKGEAVSIDLGSIGRGIVNRFQGVVDSVSWTYDRGGGARLEISAKSIDTKSKAKEPMSRHWDNEQLIKVLKAASVPAGFERVVVHASIAYVTRPYWNQDHESFIAFGQRIAREMGATFKIRGRIAIMAPKNIGTSAAGVPLKTITVRPNDNLISCRINPASARPQFKKVKARYYDRAKAKWVDKEIEVSTADEGIDATQTVVFSRPDDGEAKAAAEAEGKDVEREKGGGTVDIDGDPTVAAGATCILVGCRPGIDGEYKISSVTDRLERTSGYLTSIQLVRPDGDAGKDNRNDKRKDSKGKAKKSGALKVVEPTLP